LVTSDKLYSSPIDYADLEMSGEVQAAKENVPARIAAPDDAVSMAAPSMFRIPAQKKR